MSKYVKGNGNFIIEGSSVKRTAGLWVLAAGEGQLRPRALSGPRGFYTLLSLGGHG